MLGLEQLEERLLDAEKRLAKLEEKAFNNGGSPVEEASQSPTTEAPKAEAAPGA